MLLMATTTINDVCIQNGIDFSKAKTRNEFKRFIRKEQTKTPSISLLYKKAYGTDIIDACIGIQPTVLEFANTDTKLTHAKLAKKRHLSIDQVITSRILLTHLSNFIGFSRLNSLIHGCKAELGINIPVVSPKKKTVKKRN